jgi:hypothetical protein
MEQLAFTSEAVKFLKQVHQLGDEARLNEHQLAILLNCAEKTLQNERSRGCGIPFEKHGRQVRYRLGTVRDWMKKAERRMA